MPVDAGSVPKGVSRGGWYVEEDAFSAFGVGEDASRREEDESVIVIS